MKLSEVNALINKWETSGWSREEWEEHMRQAYQDMHEAWERVQTTIARQHATHERLFTYVPDDGNETYDEATLPDVRQWQAEEQRRIDLSAI